MIIRLRSTLGCLFFLVLSAKAAAQEPLRLLHRWEIEPNLNASWLPNINKPRIILEPARFAASERQVRLSEAQKATQHANDPALGEREASLQSILAKLKQTDENQQVQLSLASAAIALSSADHAAQLWESLRQDNATRPLIEQALVKWKSPVALQSWRTRLTQQTSSNPDIILAIEGIAATGSDQDVAILEPMLRSEETSTSLKILVAKALGALAHQDLESLAEQVTASSMEQHELIVAELLSQHTSERSRKQLIEILKSENHAARHVAYAAIVKSFGESARELAPQMITQPSNNLRLLALQVYQRFNDVDSLRQQAQAIDDANRIVRNQARKNLQQKAQIAELKPIVDEVISYQLKSGLPRGIVQAVILSVALQERERCPQLIALLDHTDIDASMTAAWGLQALVESRELLDKIFEKTEKVTTRLNNEESVTSEEILRQAYLIEALGRNRYEPALESLKLYIPKNRHKMGDTARTSAIWAIGKIKEGSKDLVVTKELAGRMLDQSIDDMEAASVQFAAAVALGYIKSPTSVEDLKKIVDQAPATLVLARDWSLKQLSEAPQPNQ